MLVKFNGERKRESRSYGCSKCGTGRSINGVETYSTVYRTYYEGRLYIFLKDKVYPVDDILGGYLVNLKYTDNEGKIRNTFEEVIEDTTATYVQDNKDKEFVIETKEEEKPKVETPKEEEKPKEEPKEEKPKEDGAIVNTGVPEDEL